MSDAINTMQNEDEALVSELRGMYEEAVPERKDEVKGLVYLSVDRLYPHPDNPRKELGDLYELTESIKARGIMQNLTVVPHEDGYRIIIGHRRAAAAREAGLSVLPCAVVEMTPEEQIATMLVENIQRSDLTAYEQAQSFQLMIDMGETVSSLSDKTGFSVSTIRRRIKLAELDPDMLKEASGKQITMDDLDRLSKIKDVKTRNIVLGFAGTVNYENELKKAIEKERQSECADLWRKHFRARGITELTMKEANSGKYSFEGWIDLYGKFSQLKDKLRDGVKFYYAILGTSIYLRSEKPSKEEADEKAFREQLREQERKRRVELLSEASKRAFESRRDFILGYSTSDAKKHIKDAVEIVVRSRFDLPYLAPDYKFFAKAIGAEEPKDSRDWNAVSFEVSQHPEYALLCHAYAILGDTESESYYAWDGSYTENRCLNIIYAFLEKLGYEMNDEERELRDGTSDLFTKEEDPDEDEDFDEDEDLDDEEEDEGDDD